MNGDEEAARFDAYISLLDPSLQHAVIEQLAEVLSTSTHAERSEEPEHLCHLDPTPTTTSQRGSCSSAGPGEAWGRQAVNRNRCGLVDQ
jgi:hypothetical protein